MKTFFVEVVKYENNFWKIEFIDTVKEKSFFSKLYYKISDIDKYDIFYKESEYLPILDDLSLLANIFMNKIVNWKKEENIFLNTKIKKQVNYISPIFSYNEYILPLFRESKINKILN